MSGRIPTSHDHTVASKPTLKTIAKLSGLAVPTVSRALNDAPDISADTKRLIRKIADEIGYVPNRAGVRLRTGRTNVISLVLSTEHEVMNHTARLITSIATGLKGTPFHMIVTPYFPNDDLVAPIRYIVESRSADAVIFNQIQPEDPRVEYLMERGFPFATHGRSKWAQDHAYYDYDNLAFSKVGVEALVRRDRKNILLIAPPLFQSYGLEMIRGFEETAARYGIHHTVAQGISSDSLNQDVRTFIADYMVQNPTTDGIISGSTNGTMAAVSGMESVGFDVGTDVDVFSKEAIQFLKFFRERLLVVHEDVSTTGKFLAQAAIRAVRDPEALPMQFLEVPASYD